MTKAERILHFIYDSYEGRSLVEIKRFAARMNGKDPDERTKDGKLKYSGYYSTNLVGTMHQFCPGKEPGLLRKYCTKLPTGKWILTEPPLPPFYRMPVPTKSYLANTAREKGEYEAQVKTWPVCPGCGHHRPPQITKMPDGMACMVTFSNAGYDVDCQGRVWLREGQWPHYEYTLSRLTKSEIAMIESLARSMVGDDWNTRSRLIRDEVRKATV